MPDQLVLRVLEHVVGLRLHGEAAGCHEDLLRAWSRCLAEPGEPVQGQIDVRIDASRAPARSATEVTAPDERGLMELTTQAVTMAGIEAGAGRLLMLHACGLVHPATGDAVVLVAPSGTGKSTAARELGRRWGYLSDETVALRRDGSVVAYPKPLSLIDETPWKRQVSPDELGLLGGSAVTSTQLILLKREATGPAETMALPLTEAIALLAPHTSYLARLDRPLHALASAVGPTGAHLITYTTLDDLESMLLDLVVTT